MAEKKITNTVLLERIASALGDLTETSKETVSKLDTLTKTSKEIGITNKGVKELLGKVSTQLGDFGNRAGKWTEAFIANDLKRIMSDHYGILLSDVERRVDIKIPTKESPSDIDVLGENSEVAVIIEVKLTIRKSHITNFTNNIVKKIHKLMPQLESKKVIGGVAFLDIHENFSEEKIIEIAEQNDLLVLKALGKHNTRSINSGEFVTKTQKVLNGYRQNNQ